MTRDDLGVDWSGVRYDVLRDSCVLLMDDFTAGSTSKWAVIESLSNLYSWDD